MMRPVCQTPHCPCSLRLLPQLVETTDSWGRRGEGRGGEVKFVFSILENKKQTT